MSDSKLAAHWGFASAHAFAALDEYVSAFDFVRHTRGRHTYAGITPGYMLEVIDGFLGEPEGVVPGGSRSLLQELRKVLVEKVEPAHREGLEAGRRCWHEGSRVYGSLPTAELHRLALEAAPADAMLRGWFVEGFCFAYASEGFESLRKELSE